MLEIEQSDVLAPTRRLPVDQMRESLAELQSMRARIDDQIDALRRLLDAVSGTNGKRSYPRKRDAVLALLQERVGEGMRLAQIRAHLIARGEIPATPKAAHALQMTLSTLAREGQVERVSQGVYKVDGPEVGDRLRDALTPYEGGLFSPSEGEQAATPTNLHRQEGQA
jgi:hypothetical protein